MPWQTFIFMAYYSSGSRGIAILKVELYEKDGRKYDRRSRLKIYVPHLITAACFQLTPGLGGCPSNELEVDVFLMVGGAGGAILILAVLRFDTTTNFILASIETTDADDVLI